MSDCIKCGSAADYHFRVLEVQTVRARNGAGESRRQAPGLFQDFSVCRACAAAYLEQIQNPWRSVGKKLLLLAALMLAGIVILLVGGGHIAVLILGMALGLCGSLGIAFVAQRSLMKRWPYAGLDQEGALHLAAWDLLLENAPQKVETNTLTYIPVNEETRSMEPEELGKLYDLLPVTAVAVLEMLRRDSE